MSTIHRSRNWLLGGYGLEYSEQRDLSVGALADLIDGLLREVLPTIVSQHNQSEVTDLKGRNAQDALLPGIGPSAHDELFRLGGLAPLRGSGEGIEFEPFEVSLLSPFKRFEGSSHIVHEIEQHRAGPLPPWLPLRLLGYAAPLRPTFMRFGLERFRSVLSFASLGYAPQVTDSNLIDCVKGRLAVQVLSERNRDFSFNPFDQIPSFRAISELLRSIMGFDLRLAVASSRG